MKIKKWHISVVLIIAGLIYAFSNMEFKSVDEYNRERAQIADSATVAGENGYPGIIFEDGVTVSAQEISEAVAEQISDEAENDELCKTKQQATAGTAQKDSKANGSKATDSKADSGMAGSNATDIADSGTYKSEKSKTEGVASGTSKSEKSKTEGAASGTDKSEKNKTESAASEKTKSGKNKSKKTDSETTKPKNQEATNVNSEAAKQETSAPIYYTCSFEVVCYELSDNPSLMTEAYRDFIPQNGVIIQNTTVKVAEGTTVYDVLNAACKSRGIAIDAVYNPFYKTYYVRGINNLYEKEAGNMSGWVYTVNGTSPMLGASSYKIKDNDSISWSYTTDGEM